MRVQVGQLNNATVALSRAASSTIPVGIGNERLDALHAVQAVFSRSPAAGRRARTVSCAICRCMCQCLRPQAAAAPI